MKEQDKASALKWEDIEEDLMTFRPGNIRGITMEDLRIMRERSQSERTELMNRIAPAFAPKDVDLLGR